MGLSGGLVVISLAFYILDPSSNLLGVSFYSVLIACKVNFISIQIGKSEIL